jgi:hypothetical protein
VGAAQRHPNSRCNARGQAQSFLQTTIEISLNEKKKKRRKIET